jgi:hypothetical protein
MSPSKNISTIGSNKRMSILKVLKIDYKNTVKCSGNNLREDDMQLASARR